MRFREIMGLVQYHTVVTKEVLLRSSFKRTWGKERGGERESKSESQRWGGGEREKGKEGRGGKGRGGEGKTGHSSSKQTLCWAICALGIQILSGYTEV